MKSPLSILRRGRADWRLLSVRVTIGLVSAVALLSVATGVANISVPSAQGPLAAFVPEVIRRTAGFTGVLTGFCMIGSAYGMRRRFRAAWYSSVVLLPVTLAQGVLQTSPLSVPLIALSVLALPNVLVNRRFFDRPLTLTSAQQAAGVAVAGVLVYGTVGTYALREEFTGVSTLADAFYYTLVTASTVGYGDATPTTQAARLFGMSVVVVGTAGFAIALGSLLAPLVEARFERALGRMSANQLDLIDDHVLVLGYGDQIDAFLETVGARKDLLVVLSDRNRVAELSERGVNALTADPDDEESLRAAGVDRAREVVVGTHDDAADALTILTVRQLDPDVHVTAVATNRENVEKLRRAGADSVVAPAVIAGKQLVRSAIEGRPRPSG